MHLGFQTDGEARLADRVRAILGADSTDGSTKGIITALQSWSCRQEQTRWAGLGNRGDGLAPTNTTMFEIGSITKLFLGLLLADAVDHGVVRLLPGHGVRTFRLSRAAVPAKRPSRSWRPTGQGCPPTTDRDHGFDAYEGRGRATSRPSTARNGWNKRGRPDSRSHRKAAHVLEPRVRSPRLRHGQG